MEQLPLLVEFAAEPTTPFLRWAGSKRRLAGQILAHAPRHFNEYIEPFVGGGAIFFALRPAVALLSDANSELMNAYRAVRDNVDALVTRIESMAASDSDAFYLECRRLVPESLGELERAARFVYLNRTCYNGLYRTNKAGEFNVPRGMKKPSQILQKDRLLRASAALQSAVIESGNFEAALGHAKAGDFVYLDPPYIPPDPNLKAFTEYTKVGFTSVDQTRVANWFELLTDRGVFVLASNSAVQEVEHLYPSHRYTHVVLQTRRNVAAKPSSRLPIDELLIANYPILGSRPLTESTHRVSR